MSYRTLHKANETYELAVMWLLIAAFLVAVALMFVHPSGAIFVFWAGLIIAAAAWGAEKVVRAVERRVARRAIARGACPACGEALGQRQPDGEEWHCTTCESIFLDSGVQIRSSTETAAR
jgi:ribosomal protein L37AE/L43A